MISKEHQLFIDERSGDLSCGSARYPTNDMFAMGGTNDYFYFKGSQGLFLLCIGEELATRTLNEFLEMKKEGVIKSIIVNFFCTNQHIQSLYTV